MYDIELLNPAGVLDCESLILPDARSQLNETDVENDLACIAARSKGKVVGLALGVFFPKNDFATCISLYVDPASRNKGIGTSLLQRIEEEVKKRKYPELTIHFKSEESCASALKKVLEKCDWGTPELNGFNYQTTTERFFKDLSWAQRSRKYPYRDYIFPWAELTEEDRRKLKEEDGPDSWRATDTSPFYFDGKFEPQTSLGLRVNGEVVGWVINHLVDPDNILFGSYFVRPKYRGVGHSIGLLLESVKRQRDSGVPKCSWYVQASNKTVKKFYQKLLGPCLTLEEEWWKSAKVLKGNISK